MLQMCHVVLGLRPRTRLEEADIVLGWLCRQESLGYRVGALWYLVNMTWWNAWTDYVNYQVRGRRRAAKRAPVAGSDVMVYARCTTAGCDCVSCVNFVSDSQLMKFSDE